MAPPFEIGKTKSKAPDGLFKNCPAYAGQLDHQSYLCKFFSSI